MTDTGSDMTGAGRDKETHAETHTAPSDQNSQEKSRVDTSAEFSQVTNSHAASHKLTRPLPRKLTFSGLSIGRPEREARDGEINKTPNREADPEPDDDLAARRREALNRLRRQQPAIRTRHHEEPR